MHHKLYDYRCVIVEIDLIFSQSDAWYENMALTKPARDKPWYHVLVHDASCMSYVAEKNLEPDLSGKPIENPLLSDFFDRFHLGLYQKKLGPVDSSLEGLQPFKGHGSIEK